MSTTTRYHEIAAWLSERIEDLTAPDLFLSEDEIIFETEIISYVSAARTLLERIHNKLVRQADSNPT